MALRDELSARHIQWLLAARRSESPFRPHEVTARAGIGESEGESAVLNLRRSGIIEPRPDGMMVLTEEGRELADALLAEEMPDPPKG